MSNTGFYNIIPGNIARIRDLLISYLFILKVVLTRILQNRMIEGDVARTRDLFDFMCFA